MEKKIRELVPEAGKTAKKEKKEDAGSFVWFCVKLLIVVLVFRSFVFTSFNIPSESMMPRLLVGDYLFAQKWSYGYSNRSLPFNAPLIPGRIFASEPDPGDVVIFEHPVDGSDYIKRVIGLPGDEVQMIAGVLHLNGVAVPKVQIEDFVLPIASDGGCRLVEYTVQEEDGSYACHYPQYRETLPNGVSYNVLDFELKPSDNTAPITVPEGHMFLMGDNRDNSMDSRFPAQPGRGVGIVPQDNLVAEASFMYWSWGDGIRFSRIGRGI